MSERGLLNRERAAFHYVDSGLDTAATGLTKREEFAKHMMAAFIASGRDFTPANAAWHAVEHADALLDELAK